MYFLSIVDDYSRRVWTYLLKTKDEALAKFKEWKTLEENQTSKKLKGLRTDNGLEFWNEEFDSLCKESGILRHRTVRKIPQQNGVAERMNRTLLDKVSCLLFTFGQPKFFWGETLNTATYLMNRSPNRAIDLKCPLEFWSGRKPKLDHLRIFGCAAYAHTKDGKLDHRSLKCVFLGYQQPFRTKGYRLWERESRGVKIIVSRDVIFDESRFPCKETSNTSVEEPREKTSEESSTSGTSIEVEPLGGELGGERRLEVAVQDGAAGSEEDN